MCNQDNYYFYLMFTLFLTNINFWRNIRKIGISFPLHSLDGQSDLHQTTYLTLVIFYYRQKIRMSLARAHFNR